jgi:hypothetical protein
MSDECAIFTTKGSNLIRFDCNFIPSWQLIDAIASFIIIAIMILSCSHYDYLMLPWDNDI